MAVVVVVVDKLRGIYLYLSAFDSFTKPITAIQIRISVHMYVRLCVQPFPGQSDYFPMCIPIRNCKIVLLNSINALAWYPTAVNVKKDNNTLFCVYGEERLSRVMPNSLPVWIFSFLLVWIFPIQFTFIEMHIYSLGYLFWPDRQEGYNNRQCFFSRSHSIQAFVCYCILGVKILMRSLSEQ